MEVAFIGIYLWNCDMKLYLCCLFFLGVQIQRYLAMEICNNNKNRGSLNTTQISIAYYGIYYHKEGLPRHIFTNPQEEKEI